MWPSKVLWCGLLASLPWLMVGEKQANGADVELKGMQFYCPDTITELRTKLQAIEGVTNVEIDRGDGSTKFKAATPAATNAALAAVAGIGLYGVPKIDGQPAKFPITAIPADSKAPRVVFRNVQLGCRAGSNGVAKALEKIEAVGTIDCDQKTNTVVITARGDDPLVVAELQAALNVAGFNAVWAQDATGIPSKGKTTKGK